MKHPLWIINSTLFILLVCVLFFIVISRVTVPARENIEPTLFSALHKEKKVQINISQIYQADLFGTQAAISPEKEVEEGFPQPPQPQTVEIPELPKPQFLDPLDITLRGIFVVSTDSARNRAIIADNKTKKESTYKMGDTLADAQLIRIFSNKVIFLRANGQQEVLYVREQDAKLDTGYTTESEWTTIIKPLSGSSFLVDPRAFVKRVSDLGQFIELLHLVTAYKQGQSIGCRIGAIEEHSLGTALGLHSGDIINTIEGIAATSTEKRLEIYKAVLAKQEGDTISVELSRDKRPLTFSYILKELFPETIQAVTPQNAYQIKKIEEDEKIKILKQKYEFAPTLQDIQNKERQLMLEKGRAPQ